MKRQSRDWSEDSSCSIDAVCGLAKVWWDFVDASPGRMRNGWSVPPILSSSSMLPGQLSVKSTLSSATHVLVIRSSSGSMVDMLKMA